MFRALRREIGKSQRLGSRRVEGVGLWRRDKGEHFFWGREVVVGSMQVGVALLKSRDDLSGSARSDQRSSYSACLLLS